MNGLGTSHGALIHRLPNQGLSKWEKPKNALINPEPTAKSRQVKDNFAENQSLQIQSQTMHSKFRFQEKITQKPLEQDLTQPFLYIEKINKKMKMSQREEKPRPSTKRKSHSKKDDKSAKPFVVSKIIANSVLSKQPLQIDNSSIVPSGYSNLFEFQEDRKRVANKLFKKMYDCDIKDMKGICLMWNRRIDPKSNPEINLKEEDFIEFMKQLLQKRVNDKELRHFFKLYKNSQKTRPETLGTLESKDAKETIAVENTRKVPGESISIKALSFNYEKYVKNETQVKNIMSEKAMKDRYKWVKQYLKNFDENYPLLKRAMKRVSDYEQTLRQHFHHMFNSYQNPFQEEIKDLEQQLLKPIIKYDKHKKDRITERINELNAQNDKIYSRISDEFRSFMDNYENTIVLNHDLFFNKRTMCKLLLPLMDKYPYLDKDVLTERIAECQHEKELYLEFLSNILCEVDRDKKNLNEEYFTLGELVDLIIMRGEALLPDGAAGSAGLKGGSKEFVLDSMKKLIKEVKKQYLLKNSLIVEDLNQFPADEEIALELLHTCFEMECTKVLVKNKIWNELITLIPVSEVTSKYHAKTIRSNECLEYIKKYLIRLDEKSTIENNHSKQISMLIENATLDNLWHYNHVIELVNEKLYSGMGEEEDQDDEMEGRDKVDSLFHSKIKPEKKVGFLDVAESVIHENNQQQMHPERSSVGYQAGQDQNQQEAAHAKDILKAIFKGGQSEARKSSVQSNQNPLFAMLGSNQLQQKDKEEIPESLSALKTLSKSFFMPEVDHKLTTKAFDIRFYQKSKQEQPVVDEIVKMGTSFLLSNLPPPEELSDKDPLKISRFISQNINSIVEEDKKLVKEKQYDSTVADGVDKNYFKEKIKLQNRPTRYDSEGKSKYSVLFPVGYYEGFMAGHEDMEEQLKKLDPSQKQANGKWYLRPHHVETLTQNPLSKKDNLINSEYESKLDRIPLKKRPDEFKIEQNVNRKEDLINSLQDRIAALKNNLSVAESNRGKGSEGATVPNEILDKYLTGILKDKEDKDLEVTAYEAVLYDLRRNERQLLNDYRKLEDHRRGQPQEKWWERKDSSFNNQLRKERLLVADSLREGSPHKEYVQQLKNKEIF